ncbi:MAG: hypothetical protein DRP50_03185 [Thermotoga sp.]|nr:MAG: hypothetical protein DRP50_03185 [Thermotoga sp.]
MTLWDAVPSDKTKVMFLQLWVCIVQDGIDPPWSLTIDPQKTMYPVGVLIFSLVRLACIKTKEMNIMMVLQNRVF